MEVFGRILALKSKYVLAGCNCVFIVLLRNMHQFKYTFGGLKPHESGQNVNKRLKFVKFVDKTSFWRQFDVISFEKYVLAGCNCVFSVLLRDMNQFKYTLGGLKPH